MRIRVRRTPPSFDRVVAGVWLSLALIVCFMLQLPVMLPEVLTGFLTPGGIL